MTFPTTAPTQKVCEICGNDEVHLEKPNTGDSHWVCDEHCVCGVQ